MVKLELTEAGHAAARHMPAILAGCTTRTCADSPSPNPQLKALLDRMVAMAMPRAKPNKETE